jgi:hypothetical protein
VASSSERSQISDLIKRGWIADTIPPIMWAQFRPSASIIGPLCILLLIVPSQPHKEDHPAPGTDSDLSRALSQYCISFLSHPFSPRCSPWGEQEHLRLETFFHLLLACITDLGTSEGCGKLHLANSDSES